jgi:hypothetical protein
LVVVEDDGTGFDLEKEKSPTLADRGMGLIGMRERAALLGGTLEVESSPGLCTTVFVRIHSNRKELCMSRERHPETMEICKAGWQPALHRASRAGWQPALQISRGAGRHEQTANHSGR